eukprot:jgi/Orpsp1_1/1192946/evm.model.d7180000097085.1
MNFIKMNEKEINKKRKNERKDTNFEIDGQNMKKVKISNSSKQTNQNFSCSKNIFLYNLKELDINSNNIEILSNDI